jgi:hypothetical protein
MSLSSTTRRMVLSAGLATNKSRGSSSFHVTLVGLRAFSPCKFARSACFLAARFPKNCGTLLLPRPLLFAGYHIQQHYQWQHSSSRSLTATCPLLTCLYTPQRLLVLVMPFSVQLDLLAFCSPVHLAPARSANCHPLKIELDVLYP